MREWNIDDFVIEVICARLARPDAGDLLTPKDSPKPRKSPRSGWPTYRLAHIEEDYDAGNIDGHRYKVATEKVQAQLTEAQRRQARLSAGRAAASTLLAANPVLAFETAPLMIRRNVIDALCLVSLEPAPRGRRTFDPESVKITWRGTEADQSTLSATSGTIRT